MEVLLPWNFDQNMIVCDVVNGQSSHCFVPNNPYNSDRIGVFYLTNYTCMAYSNGPKSSYSVSKPPQAIYSTRNALTHSSIKNDNGVPLPGVPMKAEPFKEWPNVAYTVIQHQQTYECFGLEPYPTTNVAKFLMEPHPKYNGEARYIVIAKHVLIARAFGIKSGDMYEDFMTLSYNDIKSCIGRVSTYLLHGGYNGVTVGSCQTVLMSLLHKDLFGTTPITREPPINIPILDVIKTRIDELNSSIGTLRDIYNSTEQVGRLRETLRVDHEDQLKVNDQLIESANIISELRSANNKLTNKVVMLKQNRQILNEQIIDLNSKVSNHVDMSAKQKKLIGELNGKLTSLNKRINVLEVNAAKDEAIITNLRAEKAFWNTNTTDYETKKQRDAELAELKSKIERLMD